MVARMAKKPDLLPGTLDMLILKTLTRTPLHGRSEEHTSELQSQSNLVCRLLLEKKKNYNIQSERFIIDALTVITYINGITTKLEVPHPCLSVTGGTSTLKGPFGARD